MRTLTTVLFFLWCISTFVDAAYFVKIQKEKVYGKTVKFCEYKSLRLLPGSKIKDYDDCVSCSCGKKGLICATMLDFIPSEPKNSKCKAVTIGCKSKWVLKENPKKKCPNKPKTHQLVGMQG